MSPIYVLTQSAEICTTFRMSRAAEFLLNQYNKRQLRNPRYSIRAFARDLEDNSGRISQYFNGERFLSAQAAKKISVKLNLDPSDTEYFLHLVESDKKARKSPDLKVFKDDELALLIEWHHFALASLVSVKDFRYDIAWIAERLSIPETLVTSSIEKLERVGVIKIQDGTLKLQEGPFVTTSGVPSKFLRLAHKHKLEHIIANIDNVPLEKRDLSTITLAMDERKLPQIKEKIQKFRRKLAKEYSSGVKNQVYTMCIELFPLSK